MIEPPQTTVTCAKCGKVMLGGSADGPAGAPGICAICAAHLDTTLLSEFVDDLRAPALATNGSMRVLEMNPSARTLLGQAGGRLASAGLGTATGCYYSREGPCGKAAHCASCVLRIALAGTQADGQPRYNEVSHQRIVVAGGAPPRPKRLRFSTTKVNDLVFLFISVLADDVPDAQSEGAPPAVPGPWTPTFGERFCRRHSLPSDRYLSAMRFRALHRCALPFYPIIRLLAPGYFDADHELLRSIGAARRTEDMGNEVAFFHGHHDNQRFLRRVLRIRISGRRIARIWREVMDSPE
jgi:hypothetical protein